MRRCVPRRRERAHDRVAERNLLAILELFVHEPDPRSGRQIRARTRRLDQRRQTGEVVCLYMRLEHGDDRRTCAFGRSEVLLDQRAVWIDHRKLALGQAAEHIRRAGRLLKQEWTQDHTPRLGRHPGSR